MRAVKLDLATATLRAHSRQDIKINAIRASWLTVK